MFTAWLSQIATAYITVIPGCPCHIILKWCIFLSPEIINVDHIAHINKEIFKLSTDTNFICVINFPGHLCCCSLVNDLFEAFSKAKEKALHQLFK